MLTDKLTGSYFKTEADIRPFFQRQLEALTAVGVQAPPKDTLALPPLSAPGRSRAS